MSDKDPGLSKAKSSIETPKGLSVLHLFCHWNKGVDEDQLGLSIKDAEAKGAQVVTASILGHKADICFMALAPNLWLLRTFQSGVVNAGLSISHSYVSLTEISEYAQGMPQEMQEARLFPNLPPSDKQAFCFYPMSKRRGEQDNWYLLSYEQREALMRAHGGIGRTFHGRILQVITGSAGIDDFEWGVTLFGAHADDLKTCVYTMRFDEASARYAEFGPFFFGIVAPLDQVLASLSSSALAT